eukprot:gnl/Dysnectes_brevis/2519_a3019_1881.p1 GENE.gnl/Dysnectes_brevis/2519_a3019_1881~~gnl/Dysnectes_brevis/2519_a3019_1881.p1  ORF type:complete len:399 (+),score=93.08 gnl/Dysnectes_brevis/2519_a3019_1881:111-1307(+)
MIDLPSSVVFILGLSPLILIVALFLKKKISGKQKKNEEQPLISSKEGEKTVFSASDFPESVKNDGEKPDFGIDGIFIYSFVVIVEIFSLAFLVVLWFLRNTFYPSDVNDLVSNIFLFAFAIGVAILLHYLNTIYLKFISRKMIVKEISASIKTPNSETKCLDMACGRGLMLTGVGEMLKSKLSETSTDNPQIFGIDIFSADIQSGNSPEATLVNAARVGIEGITQVHQGSVTELPFEEGTFDIITMNQSIAYIKKNNEDDEPLYRYWMRYLKPGCSLYLYDAFIPIVKTLVGKDGAIAHGCVERYSFPFLHTFPSCHYIKLTRPEAPALLAEGATTSPEAPTSLPKGIKSKVNTFTAILGAIVALVWSVFLIVLLGVILPEACNLFGIRSLYGLSAYN